MCHGCWAPSEVIGKDTEFLYRDHVEEFRSVPSLFGEVAEEIIEDHFIRSKSGLGSLYFDCRTRLGKSSRAVHTNVYRGTDGFLSFLKLNSPSKADLIARRNSTNNAYFEFVRGAGVAVHRPDVMLVAGLKRAFYEIKPASESGRRDGARKVGNLNATFKALQLGYVAGQHFAELRQPIAGCSGLSIYFKAELYVPGLITYRVCVESKDEIAPVTLALLVANVLKYIARSQARYVDLGPVPLSTTSLSALASRLGGK